MDRHQEIEIPPFFLCPISMDIMKDPVTVCTGITYDRETIEKWVFINNNTTCPVTKQSLNINTNFDTFLTPNHTLRRLIQSWCTLNSSYGIERFPTPKPPITKSHILKIINEASNTPSPCHCHSHQPNISHKSVSPCKISNSLTQLNSICLSGNTNKRCLESTPEVVEFLVRVITQSHKHDEEAFQTLSHLQISDEMILKNVLKGGALLDSITSIMKKTSYDLRSYAILLMKQLVQVAEPVQLVSLKQDHFVEVVQVIKDDISLKTTKLALNILALACPWGKNTIRVVEAGVVHVLIDLLVESKDRRLSECVLVVLELVSGCAEGRAELLGHAVGLAVVSKKILRVSHFATEKGVKILFAVSKFSASSYVLREMLEIGVVAKLCLVLQMDCEAKTKEIARDILKLRSKAWMNSRCAPSHYFKFLRMVE
ncbi:E3 ubiquitin-protein ligase PUB23-like [Amaranthus tricolor]|uniref:E3 ubiquitin-protein ligase PUB23-like n=1 Tax=Amaranthus tricolor TaxID=29722 RepID=UPI0025864BA0|nr:E3 ubiquitin-protein ligase PUB23-like [Amaranthus tricolor]